MMTTILFVLALMLVVSGIRLLSLRREYQAIQANLRDVRRIAAEITRVNAEIADYVTVRAKRVRIVHEEDTAGIDVSTGEEEWLRQLIWDRDHVLLEAHEFLTKMRQQA